jgi:hypothetical protein
MSQKATIGPKKIMIGKKKITFKKINKRWTQSLSAHELKSRVWSNFVMYFFLFYDLFYYPWLSYLLKWKESDGKKRTNKLIIKKLH